MTHFTIGISLLFLSFVFLLIAMIRRKRRTDIGCGILYGAYCYSCKELNEKYNSFAHSRWLCDSCNRNHKLGNILGKKYNLKSLRFHIRYKFISIYDDTKSIFVLCTIVSIVLWAFAIFVPWLSILGGSILFLSSLFLYSEINFTTKK